MNKELLNRLRTAGEYQKKAIYSLLSDPVGRHLDVHLNVIKKELKMMAVEIATDVLKECGKCDRHDTEQEPKRESEVKKVDIV